MDELRNVFRFVGEQMHSNLSAFASILAVLFLLAFVLFAVDKRFAVTGHYRIPEWVLMLSAVCLGAVGAFAAMLLFHHKTSKVKFIVFVPLLAVIQVVVITLCFCAYR